jgi:hypothetical protein
VRRIGAKGYEPQIHVELAELARRRGDEEGRVQELREAHQLFTEIGASAYAERVAGELGERRAFARALASRYRRGGR